MGPGGGGGRRGAPGVWGGRSPAVFVAAVVFGAVAGPALLFDLPDTAERLLPRAGLVLAPVLFAVRVVSVLLRFRTADQPSQPGRTSPDS